MKNKFPKNFLWGTATSSYQIEGNNKNSDWWQWEEKRKTKEKSGQACDYWNLWPKDHELLSQLGVNSFRLSLEWSRIEPKEGKFSNEAINHYKEIINDLEERDIYIQLTLWHWTSPIWFQEKYGFHKKNSINIFIRYVQKVLDELGDKVNFFVVFNEPMVPLGQGYLSGEFPPGYKNPIKFLKAVNNIAQAYIKAYKIIHKKNSEALVGISYLYNWYESEGHSWLEKSINGFAKWFRISLLGKKIRGYQDYFGVDYYRLGRIKFNPKKSMYFGFRIDEDEDNVMGWITYPKGIYLALKEIDKKYNLPIYILENGVPERKGLEDKEKVSLIHDHLDYVKKAIGEGVDVRGYNYWSLLDNFEWLYGYEPRFGLIEIDYKTQERKPRQSFWEYKKIIEENE